VRFCILRMPVATSPTSEFHRKRATLTGDIVALAFPTPSTAGWNRRPRRLDDFGRRQDLAAFGERE